MDKKTAATIRELQANLIRIKNNERFFYNIGQYKSLGLIKEAYKNVKDVFGNTERVISHYVLTSKAEQYIKVSV